MITKGELITGEVQDLAFGGFGVIRHEGLVIFVPFTAPGDRIVCRVTKCKKNFAEGEIVEILQKGTSRISPLCPHYGRCGGCQLQHLNYAAQLKYKQNSVKDALTRIGGFSFSEVPVISGAEAQWSYRRHVTLSLHLNSGGHFSAGYVAADHYSFLEISQCPIFVDPKDPLIHQVQTVAEALQADPGNEGRVVIMKHQHQIPDRYVLLFHFKHLPANALNVLKKALEENKNWSGIQLKAPRYNQALGDSTLQCRMDSLTFSFSPEAFIQNHPEQSLAIYRKICSIAETSPAGVILDLYCGIGISSLMIAKAGKKVLGVESNAEAVKLANDNAKMNGISTARFIKADVKDVVLNLLKKESPGMVLINPPRIGLEKSVRDAFLEGMPNEIIYVSCMPSTLARDLKELSAKYEILSCTAYDMFPQTAHVETLVHLKKT
jgi:23S rRNA (uracil1939-C5)-methyltransferase